MQQAAFVRFARLGFAVGLAAAWAIASAAPYDSKDPVAELLAERGLAEPEAEAATPPGLVGRVRHKAGDMIVSAMNFLGMPYRRGGNGDEGFDCSGFTRHIFESSLGFVLPRRVDEQAHAPGLEKVRRDELEPGDLVFFNTLRRTFSHVGIYIGDGKFIHAPRSGARVRVEDMRQRYWTQRFTGARRAEPLRTASAATEVTGAPAATPGSSRIDSAETIRQSY